MNANEIIKTLKTPIDWDAINKVKANLASLETTLANLRVAVDKQAAENDALLARCAKLTAEIEARWGLNN